jgi:DNA-binding transcriptional LysR family regulator
MSAENGHSSLRPGEIDRHRLETFLTVADLRNLTQAAQVLQRSQPSVSQSIRSLERSLHTQLFERAGRGIDLTASGRALVPAARRILESMDSATQAVAQVRRLETATLVIATVASLGLLPVAALAGAMARRHPGTQLHLSAPGGSQQVIDAVRRGTAEIGICQQTDDASNLVRHPLGTEDVVALVPPGWRPPPGGVIRLEDLADEPLVLPGPSNVIRTLVEHAFRDLGLRPRLGVEVEGTGVVALVAEGMGPTFLSSDIARHTAPPGTTVWPISPAITQSIELVHRRSDLTPAAGRFVQLALARPWPPDFSDSPADKSA